MNSNNGDLYFKAGIDIDNFNVSAKAMEERVKQVSSTVVSESGSMENAISQIGSAFTKLVGAGSAVAFVKQVFNIRSEMQNTEAMFKVFLGTAEKASAFMEKLQDYAYYNVFEFKDLAEQSAQLLAFGSDVEDVIPTINKLSEIAAGTNAPLENLVTVWNKVKASNTLDAHAIMSLSSSGINVRQVMAEITEMETGMKTLAEDVDVTGLHFSDLQKVIDHVATEDGMFVGMMEEKMKTLGDTFGLMQDNITNMFNEIGEATQDYLRTGMNVANYLIENYKEVAKVLATLVVAYGAVKAANIAMSLAQKNGTGVAVIDNTTMAIRSTLMKAEITNGTNLTKTIREKVKAQQEEIATLRASITEQEHENIISQNRVANLNDILTAQQKARLEQLGINKESEEYIPLAVSMLSKEQQMAMQKAELTNNNNSYIEAMKGVITARKEELGSIDDRIEAAKKALELAEKEASSAMDTKEQLQEKVNIMQDYYDQSLQNINATDLQERQEALESAQSELEAASKAAESAAEQRNTAQKQLNELQTKKSTLATAQDTTATNVNTTSKNLLSVAVGKLKIGLQGLWAVMKANPVGAILTVFTALVSVISHFVNKSKEAKKAQEEENKAMADFSKEVNTAKDRLNTLRVTLSTASAGTSVYNNALKEVNDMCKEYNVELINTNDNLQTQTEKYASLESAIEGVTAAKLREQYTTKALENQSERNEDLMSDFRKNLGKKSNSGKASVEAWEDDTKFTTMWNLMLSKAQEVANGGSQGKALYELLNAMKKLSGIRYTDESLAYERMKEAFVGLVSSAKEAQEEMKKSNKALSIFNQTIGARKTATEETKTSVADLNKQLKEQNAIIAQIQAKAKTSDGINDAEKKQLENAQSRKDDLEKQLKSLGVETRTKTATDVKKSVEELTKLENELEIERLEAEIAIEKYGAEKKRKQVELDHMKRIAQIKVQEEEYLKAIKESKKSPSTNAVESFDSQYKAEREQYENEMKKVYANEIEEKKKQYEEYQKWVSAINEEAANKQFADLIAQGKTFEEWVGNEIKRIEGKSKATSNDIDYINQLDKEKGNQYSSYYKMFEDLQKQIDNAPNMAVKLRMLNEEIERLKNDGKTSDSKDDVLLRIAQMRNDTMEELNRQFAEKYKAYSKSRRDVVEEYSKAIEQFKNNNDEINVEKVKKDLSDALREIDVNYLKSLFGEAFGGKATKKALKAVLKDLKEMKGMDLVTFNSTYNTDFTEQELESLKQSIDDVNDSLKEMGTYNIADAFKDIRNGRIDGDLEKVARGTQHIKDVFSNFTSVVGQLSSALNDLAEASDNENLTETAKTVESVSNVLSSAGSWAGTGASIGGGWGALIGAIIGGSIGVIEEILNKNAQEEEQRKQDVEDAKLFMQDVISGIGNMVSSINSLNDTIASLNYENFRETLLSSINSMRSDINYQGEENWKALYDGVTTEGALGALDDSHIQEVVNDLIGYLYSGSESRDSNFRENTQELINKIQGLSQEQQRELVNAWASGNIKAWLDNEGELNSYMAKFWAGKLNWDNRPDDSVRTAYANQENQKDYELELRRLGLLKELTELYESGSVSALEYFNLMLKSDNLSLDLMDRRKKQMEEAGLTNTEEYLQLLNDIEELKYNMGQRLQDMAEGFYGTDIQSIIENWIDIFKEFGDDVDGAFDKIDESIEDMINNMIFKTTIIEPLMQKMSKVFSEYSQEVGDDHQYSTEDFKELARRIGQLKQEALESYQAYLEAIGEDMIGNGDTNSLTGAIQNVSEETAGIIAGRMNAIVINQAESISVLRQSLITQIEIKNNTTKLADDVRIIKHRLTGMTSVNSKLNYGITE